jgi:hypothetical protein
VALVIAAAWWFFGRTPAPRPRPTPLPTPSATPLAPGPTPSVDPSPASTSPGSSQTTPTIPINPGSNDLPVPTGPALPLGQPGLAGTYEYVVNSVQLSQRPILELFPPEGVYVIVNLTVTLRDDNPDPLVVFYNSNVALLDTGGVQHLVTGHSVMFDDALTIALLEPNDPVTGNVVFDLPPTATSGAALLAADQTLGHTVKLDLGLS